MPFRTTDGVTVPTVDTAQMREVDRVAVEEFRLGILQMMENAGRTLAEHAMDMLPSGAGPIVVLAGAGGNGGGGLSCARHLHNHHLSPLVALARAPDPAGPAGQQLRVLRAAGLSPLEHEDVPSAIASAELIVDALIGYGLVGPARGRAARWIELATQHRRRVLSLDVPSGLDTTRGRATGPVMRPARTVTLALPKVGLEGGAGELFLAGIGIPPAVYCRLGIAYQSPFFRRYWVALEADEGSLS